MPAKQKISEQLATSTGKAESLRCASADGGRLVAVGPKLYPVAQVVRSLGIIKQNQQFLQQELRQTESFLIRVGKLDDDWLNTSGIPQLGDIGLSLIGKVWSEAIKITDSYCDSHTADFDVAALRQAINDGFTRWLAGEKQAAIQKISLKDYLTNSPSPASPEGLINWGDDEQLVSADDWQALLIIATPLPVPNKAQDVELFLDGDIVVCWSAQNNVDHYRVDFYKDLLYVGQELKINGSASSYILPASRYGAGSYWLAIFARNARDQDIGYVRSNMVSVQPIPTPTPTNATASAATASALTVAPVISKVEATPTQTPEQVAIHSSTAVSLPGKPRESSIIGRLIPINEWPGAVEHNGAAFQGGPQQLEWINIGIRLLSSRALPPGKSAIIYCANGDRVLVFGEQGGFSLAHSRGAAPYFSFIWGRQSVIEFDIQGARYRAQYKVSAAEYDQINIYTYRRL